MEKNYELLMMVDELYNMAYSSLRQEEYRIKQRQIERLISKAENTATGINYESMLIERDSQQWNMHMKRMFELREDIFDAIKQDNEAK